MTIDRRKLLQAGGISALSAALPKFVQAQPPGSRTGSPEGAADQTIRIGNGLVELAPDRIISTTIYNGQFPGSLLRFKEGRQVVVDIHNDTILQSSCTGTGRPYRSTLTARRKKERRSFRLAVFAA